MSRVYIAGEWRDAGSADRIDVVSPIDGMVIGSYPACPREDVDAAVRAAAGAFDGWADTPVADRLALLRAIGQGIEARADEIAATITREMGTPIGFSRAAQIGLPLRNLALTVAAMEEVGEEKIGRSVVLRDPIGVVAAITPWNFPLHQIVAKVIPALAAGCTVVLKPSELTPIDAEIFAEIVDQAGVPAGVVNLVFGAAATGEALVTHPLIDMVSFTGSTRAGRRIAELAGRDLKKVALELGGKSANIVLDDADLEKVIPAALGQCFVNAGQTCAALTRLIVPEAKLEEAGRLAVAAAARWTDGERLGPLASAAQRQRVHAMIDQAVRDGARVLTGGSTSATATPHVLPTVLTNVMPDMEIAREEVFGPVLVLMGHAGDADAVRIANDSDYGLSGGVWSADEARARKVARRLRTGQVMLNGAMLDLEAPFGGVGHSGIGREYGRYGLEEFFSLKAITA